MFLGLCSSTVFLRGGGGGIKPLSSGSNEVGLGGVYRVCRSMSEDGEHGS